MKTVELPIGTYTFRDDHVVEVVTREGIDIDEAMAGDIVSLIAREGGPRMTALVDRQHSYSLTHRAMKTLAAAEGIVAIALLVYSKPAEVGAEIQAGYAGHTRVFQDRAEANTWLLERLAAAD